MKHIKICCFFLPIDVSVILVASSILSSVLVYNGLIRRRRKGYISLPSISIVEGECYVLEIVLYLKNPIVFLYRSWKKFIVKRTRTKCFCDFIRYFYENAIFIVSMKLTFSFIVSHASFPFISLDILILIIVDASLD